MFSDLQLEVADRLLAVQTFFKTTGRVNNRQAVAMIKGLTFVELYAVYEYTVIGAVREAVLEMKNRSTPINTVRLELLCIALHRESARLSRGAPPAR